MVTMTTGLNDRPTEGEPVLFKTMVREPSTRDELALVLAWSRVSPPTVVPGWATRAGTVVVPVSPAGELRTAAPVPLMRSGSHPARAAAMGLQSLPRLSVTT